MGMVHSGTMVREITMVSGNNRGTARFQWKIGYFWVPPWGVLDGTGGAIYGVWYGTVLKKPSEKSQICEFHPSQNFTL